jgi:hypothetical protein
MTAVLRTSRNRSSNSQRSGDLTAEASIGVRINGLFLAINGRSLIGTPRALFDSYALTRRFLPLLPDPHAARPN